MNGMKASKSLTQYRANLQGEVDSAALYRTLASVEKNSDLATIYERLTAVEEAHAEYWKKKLREAGALLPTLQPHSRTRALRWLARRFGPAFVLPSVSTLEHLDGG